MKRALVLLALTGGCLAEEDPNVPVARCGDGLCNAVETATTCPSDCDVTCDMAVPESCAGETICLGSQCVDAFGRLYRFRVVDLTAAEFDPQGALWDDSLDGPDPVVEVAIDDDTVLRTEIAEDVFEVASFLENADTMIESGSVIRVTAFDFDEDFDTPMLACEADLTLEILRAGGVSCIGSEETFGSAFTVEITPR